MSLARAFTKRREKRSIDATGVPPTPMRASARESVKMVSRAQISSPVALLSTTNMLSYNAPDIAVYRQQQKEALAARKVSSSSSSTHSNSTNDDSDNSSVSSQTKDSFLTDNSSVDDNSPTDRSPSLLEENHLSQYFPSTKSLRRSVSTSDMGLRLSASTESPAIPQRAPSHSKKAHEASLARKRSLQTWDRERESVNSAVLSNTSSIVHTRSTSALSTSRSSQPRSTTPTSQPSSTTRTSFDFFRSNLNTSSTIDPNHPFGKELEQLNEVAEEFVDVVRDAEWEADSTQMSQRGLVRYCANDYLQDLEPLFGKVGFWMPVMTRDGGFF